MSGEDDSGVQIKLFLIGGDGVGKSSFIDKINSLNCSKSHSTTNNENSPITSNTKEYNCNGFKIFIQGFIVEGPVEMKNENDFSSSDEDEVIREEYHIKFSPTKKSIIKFISSNNSNLPAENVFVFFYDLSDFNSIEKLMLFYESINRKFKLSENQIKSILIGNKMIKKLF
jgi:GTPase SAR1 family protein